MILASEMPKVDVPPDLEDRFTKARLVASRSKPANPTADPSGERCIVVVTPSRTFAILRSPARSAMPPQAVQALEKVAPSIRPLNITVIAYIQFDALLATEAKPAPIIGLTIGLSHIGHNVVVFEGHPSAFHAGCRDADLLVVDETMIRHLQKDWEPAARSTMRGSEILIVARSGTLTRLAKKS